MSYPERVIRGVNLGLKRYGICQGEILGAGRFPLARQVLLSLGGAYSVGVQDPQSSCPGSRLRPVIDPKFTVDIARVGFDRVQREVKPGSDFSIG